MSTGYNMIKGPGFLGTGGRDRSRGAGGVSADPRYGLNDDIRQRPENLAATKGMTDAELVKFNQTKRATQLQEEDDLRSGKKQLDEELSHLKTPSLTDELLSKARKNAYLKLTTGQSRKGSFSAGMNGDLSASQPVNRKSLLQGY